MHRVPARFVAAALVLMGMPPSLRAQSERNARESPRLVGTATVNGASIDYRQRPASERHRNDFFITLKREPLLDQPEARLQI